MKKIFLDFGANKLQGYKNLKKKHKIDNTWEVHHYEPNPHLKDFLNNNITHGVYHNKAVWDKNEILEFVTDISLESWQGSHIDQGSKTFLDRAKGPTEKISIEAIDVYDIFNQYDTTDQIIVKMDIETAEFRVLQRMIDTDQMKKVNKIYIEFHCRMFGDKRAEYRQWQDRLVKDIKKLGVKYKEYF